MLENGTIFVSEAAVQLGFKGKMVTAKSYAVNGQKIVCTGKFIKTARIEEEWYEDVEEPESIIQLLKKAKRKPDIFTFWQRFPETAEKYSYHKEPEAIAVATIKDFDDWYKKQIDTNARRAIKKANKIGVKVELVEFSNEFIEGMVNIFNETPIRQGKQFWHYGKDFAKVRSEFSKYLHREDLLGAYYEGDLIGFMFLANAGKFALLTQLISKTEHRDKATDNALIAKAVEVCQIKKIPFFIFLNWGNGSLTEFKRRNGFKKVIVPRYYIPLTKWGKIVLTLHIHRGLVGVLPDTILARLKNLRRDFYARIKPVRKT